GYKVHLTETCEDDAPHLITQVETTPATTADGDVTAAICAALQEQGLLPDTHVVDTGYLDAELLVTSQREYGVRLLGPAHRSGRWTQQPSCRRIRGGAVCAGLGRPPGHLSGGPRRHPGGGA
ncbi:MAG: hypothetical protein NTZ05_13820, partial [Chloroflexi bacterium]|nr:hypothetical protein [Chloroflexota bacterium]